jgi:predicted ester cyclase
MGATAMTKADLSDIYRDYIACLNKQDWPNLGQFVHEDRSATSLDGAAADSSKT